MLTYKERFPPQSSFKFVPPSGGGHTLLVYGPDVVRPATSCVGPTNKVFGLFQFADEVLRPMGSPACRNADIGYACRLLANADNLRPHATKFAHELMDKFFRIVGGRSLLAFLKKKLDAYLVAVNPR
jgi:hypothetical protein